MTLYICQITPPSLSNSDKVKSDKSPQSMDSSLLEERVSNSCPKECVKPLKLSREAIWHVSEDPYHIIQNLFHEEEIMFRGFFSTSGKFHIFFFNPSLS